MRGTEWMCINDEERRLLYELGLKINWNCISDEEWQQMNKRNEHSKQLEKQTVRKNKNI